MCLQKVKGVRRHLRITAIVILSAVFALLAVPSTALAAPPPPGGTSNPDFAVVCRDWINSSSATGDINIVDEYINGDPGTLRQICDAAQATGGSNFNGRLLSTLCYAGFSGGVVVRSDGPNSPFDPSTTFGTRTLRVNLSPEGRTACQKVCNSVDTAVSDATRIPGPGQNIVRFGADVDLECTQNPSNELPAAAEGQIDPRSVRTLCQDFIDTEDQGGGSTPLALGGAVGAAGAAAAAAADAYPESTARDNQVLPNHSESMTRECERVLDGSASLPTDTLQVLCRDIVSNWGEQDQPKEGGGTFDYAVVDHSGQSLSACSSICSLVVPANVFGANIEVSTECTDVATPTNASFQPPDPGLNVENINELSSGFSFYALLAAIVGICVSAALWAMGSKGQNPGTELAGKKGMIVCCSAAFVIGAVPSWINYLDGIAKDADENGVTEVCVPIRNGEPSSSEIDQNVARGNNSNGSKAAGSTDPSTGQVLQACEGAGNASRVASTGASTTTGNEGRIPPQTKQGTSGN